ncbi:MAG: hypothetical protein ACPHJ3_14835, partial [Rubripirellula sp.]
GVLAAAFRHQDYCSLQRSVLEPCQCRVTMVVPAMTAAKAQSERQISRKRPPQDRDILTTQVTRCERNY